MSRKLENIHQLLNTVDDETPLFNLAPPTHRSQTKFEDDIPLCVLPDLYAYEPDTQGMSSNTTCINTPSTGTMTKTVDETVDDDTLLAHLAQPAYSGDATLSQDDVPVWALPEMQDTSQL